jgi:hypothetical protein
MALAALAACYRPASDRCGVVGTTCEDAAGDTPADVEIDGPPSPDACTMPTAAGGDTPFTGVVGTYFVGVFRDDFPAAMLKTSVATGLDDVVVQLGQSFAGSFEVAVPGLVDAEVDAPRLAPDGLEIFLRIDHPSSGKSELARTTRAPNGLIWSVPKALTIDGQSTFSNIAVPSPPTTTTPRRMIVSQGAGSFDEVQETTPDGLSWTVVQHVDTPAFGVNYSGEASLTADARFLVFRGKPGSVNQAFYVPRDANGKFTATGTPLLGPISSANEPYLAPDCRHLFYTDAPNGQVHMVTY